MKKVALVTGVGRKRGIGAAICRDLAQRGNNVFFTYWHEYDLADYQKDNLISSEILVAELQGLGVRAAGLEIDLRDAHSPAILFKAVENELGALQVLINNATIGKRQSLSEITAESLDEHYAVNVRATTLLCIEFIKRGNAGKIINITSGQALGPMKAELPYAITKASVDMLALQLGPELTNLGISINAFDPGPTDTGWITDEIRTEIEKKLKINTPQEVAAAVVSLLDTDTTGKVIHYGR